MAAPLMIDRRFDRTEILAALDTPVGDTTVWSGLRTPFLALPAGAMAALRRPIARVASSLGSPRSGMADAEKGQAFVVNVTG